MAQAKQDMGSGSVKKLMLQLMIPAVVAQVVNLLYNIVDRIYIGHIAGIGAAALTGVGLFTPILMLLNAFAMLVGAGGAPRTAIALGQGDRQQAEKIISNSFTVLMLFAVVLTIGYEDSEREKEITEYRITIPRVSDLFAPALAVIPAQLFAYYCAIQRGYDPDKPRNLAKSVTVE